MVVGVAFEQFLFEPEMEQISALIARVLAHPGDVEELDRVRVEVETLCRRFPLYPARWTEPE